MFRVAVLQNQSESQRSSYANVTRNLRQSFARGSFEFDCIDSGNMARFLSAANDEFILNYDAIFVSTNATSDSALLDALNRSPHLFEQFLNMGKGLFLSYQKKMAFATYANPIDFAFIPPRYRVHMLERPSSEPNSGAGKIDLSAPMESLPAAAYLLLSSPNAVDSQAVMGHCLENDFKAHLYRACIRAHDLSAYDAVLADTDYKDGFGERNLLSVNRYSEFGERVVVSTIALDWEGHYRLLENILEYIAAGIPRLALYASQPSDTDMRFFASTAHINSIPFREYAKLEIPPLKMSAIHDVYVISSSWTTTEVQQFWSRLTASPPAAIVDATRFRRLYHLGGSSSQSVTKFVNFSPIDIMLNEAILWLQSRFVSGFWGGGFWNTHDVLMSFQVVGIDVSPFLPSVLEDIDRHLRDGAYDAVMGPTCGVLSLLNSLCISHGDQLREAGFGLERRSEVAIWVCANARDQSEIARQVAAQALFSVGGEDTVALVRSALGDAVVDSLQRVVRQVDYLTPERISAYSSADLIRLIELGRVHSEFQDLVEVAANLLIMRQSDSGSWGNPSETANAVSCLITTSTPDEGGAYEAVLRGVDALQEAFDAGTGSWNEGIQHTAACVRALGLFNTRHQRLGREGLEAVELKSLTSNRASVIGQARIDLAKLHKREQERSSQLAEMRSEVARLKELNALQGDQLIRGERRTDWFQRVAVVAGFLFAGLVGSLLIGQPRALAGLITGVGSVLGLIIGAMVAVPITLWLAPKSRDNQNGHAKGKFNAAQ